MPKPELTPVEEADIALTRAAAPFYRSAAGRALGTLGKVGDEAPLLGLAAIMALLGTLRRDRKLTRAGMNMVRAEVVAILFKSIGKRLVDRSRPRELIETGHYEMHRGTSSAYALQSFPSGHTAGAIAVARAFGGVYPERAGAALAAASFIGLLQLPRQAHFASDVAVGAILGVAAERLSR